MKLQIWTSVLPASPFLFSVSSHGRAPIIDRMHPTQGAPGPESSTASRVETGPSL